MFKPYTQHGQVRIECEHCDYMWIQATFTEAGYLYLDGNEEQECPECKGAFDFDDWAGNVTPLLF